MKWRLIVFFANLFWDKATCGIVSNWRSSKGLFFGVVELVGQLVWRCEIEIEIATNCFFVDLSFWTIVAICCNIFSPLNSRTAVCIQIEWTEEQEQDRSQMICRYLSVCPMWRNLTCFLERTYHYYHTNIIYYPPSTVVRTTRPVIIATSLCPAQGQLQAEQQKYIDRYLFIDIYIYIYKYVTEFYRLTAHPHPLLNYLLQYPHPLH